MPHRSLLVRRLAAGLAIASLALAGTPGAVRADGHDAARHEPNHDASHGPMPIAIIGGIVSSAFWLVSLPFCALIAPKHIGDSFDAMVAAPFRATIGAED